MRVTRILKKTVKYLGILGLVILLVVCASIPLARMEHPGDLLAVNNKHALAINNVNLVTMNGDQVLMNQQILIRDGIIEQFGPAGQADQ